MKAGIISYIILFITITVVIVSCVKDFDIDVKTNKQQLVVEGYINNSMRYYNYVALSRSQDFYTPDLNNAPVRGAKVFITEGELQGTGYKWDTTTRIQLKEVYLPRVAPILLPGIYFDTVLANNPGRALLGKVGKHYLLEIEVDGKKYTATTKILQPVIIDSVTSGYHFEDHDDDTVVIKARITAHYKDPDTIGNAQLYYWRRSPERARFGWGGLGASRYTPGTDDLVNGQYIRVTHPTSFIPKDSVDYYLTSVERPVYNFWDSYNKAKDNAGPFATPITLLSTIKGEDVIGCFSGFGISSIRLEVK